MNSSFNLITISFVKTDDLLRKKNNLILTLETLMVCITMTCKIFREIYLLGTKFF